MTSRSEHPPRPASGQALSRLFTEDGQQFLRVTATHAISTDWLAEHLPDLYRTWRNTADTAGRDRLAAHIESRFTALEPNGRNPAPDAVPAVRARQARLGRLSTGSSSLLVVHRL